MNLRSYWHIMRTSIREDGANPPRLVTTVVQQVLRVLMIVAVYKVAYAVSGAQTSLSYVNAMWTIGLCFAYFMNLGVRNIARTIDAEIRTGNVEVAIIKPIDWRLAKFFQHIGKSGVEFLVQSGVMGVVLLFTVGPPVLPDTGVSDALIFILLFILSIITAAALFITVGLTAFWLNDAMPVFRIVDKLSLIFCGSFVPIALMPSIMQHIVRYSPFDIYAAPTRVFDPTMRATLMTSVVSGLVWTVAMVLLCQFVWWRVHKKIEVNGG